jgi:hypothetical protein
MHDASRAVDYFSEITFDGIRFKCPDHSNPADYFMNIISKESIEYVKSNNPEVLKKSLQSRDNKYTARIDHFEEVY